MTSTRHLPLMLALTFSTGVIDAVGYLGLDRVFTGNMTGNVVILGMALAGADNLPILGPFLALVCFMTGAAIAGAVLRDAAVGWRARTTHLLLANTAVLAAISVLLFINPHPSHHVDLAITAVLGLTMGCQAGTARHISVREVTTVVVTSTITALAAESWFGNRAGAQASRRGSAIVLIMAGAALGALVLKHSAGGAVAIAAVIAGAVALLGEHERRALVQVQRETVA